MPDLWLAGDDFVGKVAAMGQPTRPTQTSMDLGMETIKGQTRLCMAVWSQVKVGGRTVSLRPYARSVCGTKAPLQLRYAACGAI